MSLSCEVCPAVIQAVNQITLSHDDFVHEIIDGDLVQEEVQALNIQGTPALFAGKVAALGASDFLQLLEK